MKVHQAYDTWAMTYDSDENRTRDLDHTVCQEMLASFRCSQILELGCGTGKNTSFLSTIGADVLAVDFSEEMLAKAREKVPSANVSFALADVQSNWPVTDELVDLIVCDLVLEHIENLAFIFSEVFRCLTVGGRLFVSELHPFRQYLDCQANFQREGSTIRIPAFVHHVSDYVKAGDAHGLCLDRINEHWHADDIGKPPRILSLLFSKRPRQE